MQAKGKSNNGVVFLDRRLGHWQAQVGRIAALEFSASTHNVDHCPLSRNVQLTSLHRIHKASTLSIVLR